MWGENKWLDTSTLAQNTSPWKVTENLALKGGQEGLHARGRGGGGVALGSGTVPVVLDSELSHLTFTMAVVKDEQGEA